LERIDERRIYSNDSKLIIIKEKEKEKERKKRGVKEN